MNEIDTALQDAVDRRVIPGVVALATNATDVIYEGASGRRRIDDDAPMTVDTVFQIMDSDRSGAVDYIEFVRHIFKMKTADEQTLLNFIRHTPSGVTQGTAPNVLKRLKNRTANILQRKNTA